MTVRVKCWKCGKLIDTGVSEEQYSEWRKSGKLIQDAMPDISSATRELLISGTCDDCFDNLFLEEE